MWGQIAKSTLCKIVGISRNLLYYEYKQEAKDIKIKDKIEKVLADNKYYGSVRIALELKLNKKRIKRVMKKYGILTYKQKKKPFKKEDMNKPDTQIPNMIKNICPLAPNVIWSSDFTYIPYGNGFIYLSTVLDIYTREVVGVNISKYHNAELVTKALIDALTKENAPMYLHSDQGSEYTSLQYINLVKQAGIIFSNSKKSSPWENGYQESFYSHFKEELGDTNRFKTVEELIEAVYQQIYYYNNNRIHTALKMKPAEFKKAYLSNNLMRQVV